MDSASAPMAFTSTSFPATFSVGASYPTSVGFAGHQFASYPTSSFAPFAASAGYTSDCYTSPFFPPRAYATSGAFPPTYPLSSQFFPSTYPRSSGGMINPPPVPSHYSSPLTVLPFYPNSSPPSVFPSHPNFMGNQAPIWSGGFPSNYPGAYPPALFSSFPGRGICSGCACLASNGYCPCVASTGHCSCPTESTSAAIGGFPMGYQHFLSGTSYSQVAPAFTGSGCSGCPCFASKGHCPCIAATGQCSCPSKNPQTAAVGSCSGCSCFASNGHCPCIASTGQCSCPTENPQTAAVGSCSGCSCFASNGYCPCIASTGQCSCPTENPQTATC